MRIFVRLIVFVALAFGLSVLAERAKEWPLSQERITATHERWVPRPRAASQDARVEAMTARRPAKPAQASSPAKEVASASTTAADVQSVSSPPPGHRFATYDPSATQQFEEQLRATREALRQSRGLGDDANAAATTADDAEGPAPAIAGDQ